jgi:subtilisin family serine protease
VNTGSGVTGVAPYVEIMAVKVLSKYGGTSVDIIRGINFATKNGAKVINASLGIMSSIHIKSDFDYLMYEAIQNFPGLFIAAAGNNGMNTDGVSKAFPAGFGSDTTVSGEVIIDREQAIVSGEEIIPALMNVISVGATNQDDNIASFSNYGLRSVHITAPGVNIYSSIPSGSVVGTTETISYVNGWTRKIGSNPNTWTTRSNPVISGESIDISAALWADIRTPYVSGESSYIEKNIPNPTQDVAKVLITTWCDTPSSGDQIDILLASNGGLYNRVDWTNEYYNSYEPTGRRLDIDGHIGAIAQYRIIANTATYNATGSFDLRLKWVTDTIENTEDGMPNYGCFVKDIQIDRSIAGGYDNYDGTSMASPHVAGAAALAMSYSPTASIQEVRDAIIWG